MEPKQEETKMDHAEKLKAASEIGYSDGTFCKGYNPAKLACKCSECRNAYMLAYNLARE